MMVCINQVNAVNGRQLIHEHGEVMASWRAGAAEKANAAEANPSPEPSGTLRQVFPHTVFPDQKERPCILLSIFSSLECVVFSSCVITDLSRIWGISDCSTRVQ
jgi:hypothetical protein